MKIPIQIQARSIKKIYESLYEDLKLKYGLTMNEIMFLLYLDKHKMKNTASEIVDDLMVTKSHISKSVDSLVKENIIIRVQDEYDRKVIRLYISKTADKLLEELKQRERLIDNNIIKGITNEEIIIFNDILERIKRNILELSAKSKN